MCTFWKGGCPCGQGDFQNAHIALWEAQNIHVLFEKAVIHMCLLRATRSHWVEVTHWNLRCHKMDENYAVKTSRTWNSCHRIIPKGENESMSTLWDVKWKMLTSRYLNGWGHPLPNGKWDMNNGGECLSTRRTCMGLYAVRICSNTSRQANSLVTPMKSTHWWTWWVTMVCCALDAHQVL